MDWALLLPPLILIIINTLVLLYVFRDYLKTRNRTLVLLIGSIFFFLLASVTAVVFSLTLSQIQEGGFDSAQTLVSTLFHIILNNLFAIISIYFLILFFQSFRQENLATRRNILLAVSSAVLFTATFLTMLYLRISLEAHPEFAIDTSVNVTIENPALITQILMVSSGVFLALSFLFLIIVVFNFIKEVRKSLNAIKNPRLKSTARMMKYSIYVMVIGGLFLNSNRPDSPIGIASPIIFILGMLGFIFSYHRGGLFFLQGDDLKRLIIINPSGSPIYSYNFRKFANKQGETISEQQNQEVLFSGALKSISMLLAEFTGEDKMVKEIILEDLVMIIKTFENNSSVVLFVETSTRFVREALEEFSQTIKELVVDLKPGLAFSNDEVKVSNSIIEEIFGQSYIMTQAD